MLEAARRRGRSRPPLAVVILAAGQGTRMRSATPKIMHRIAGRALVEHVLASAAALKPERLVVVLAPKMEQVAATVAPAKVAVQHKARGTADAVSAAMPALDGFNGDVVIAYGDQPLITAATLRELRDRLADAGLAVLGFRPADTAAYGRLILDESGALAAIREHRDANADERRIDLCNSGVMAVRGDVLRRLLPRIGSDNAKGEFYLTDLVALARAEGIRCAVSEGDEDELHGVNSRSELANAEAIMQRRLREAAMEQGATLLVPEAVYLSFDTKLARDVIVGPNVFFGTGVSVGEGSEIHSFCHFLEAKVGRNTSIGPFARLRPGAVIGDGAHIGNFVEIKASTIAPGAKINHLSYVGDSSVGSGTNIGAGTITCNYDGFLKHRTKIGRNVFIGSDTALVAPVTVGDGAVIGAGSVVTKDVAKDALVVARADERHLRGAARRYRAKKMAELARKNAAKSKPLRAAAAQAKVSKTARPSHSKKGRPSAAPK
ncbi:MAG TPA: bifunctional UDP-N-acetylglucosamine diphosphorylase/glucosamine-1-phosphate N-acetyltransferase GlmU [Alphaproteobacteria bacterium]|jgi:bifunctional UDP-N-acetylglucosamine pyrophosphorylase/glucosamine-1-phosphate N-acetyltransferase|nr:bifunctional UDP-N-acetylglucosamine diphosphorylase/glucosamine-1-phosphate N-acetyltransferase GlmU [Alphaproteobacteria bacterium]